MSGFLRWYGRRYLIAITSVLAFTIVCGVSTLIGSYIAGIFHLGDDGTMYVIFGCVGALLLIGGLAFERLQRWWLYDRNPSK